MKQRYIYSIAFLTIAAAFASVGGYPKSAPWRASHFENVLGTSMEIKLIASSEEVADRAETAAMDEIKRLNGILSGYDAKSEFSRWAGKRDEAVRVSPEMFEVLELWDTWRKATGGALNPAAEAVTRVWKTGQAEGRMPSEAEMSVAATAAQQPQWKLEAASGLATRLTGTPLVLNSFTKSYVIDRAASAAMSVSGVSGVVLNIGGDLVVRGNHSDTVDVSDPRSDEENSDPIARLDISDRAVATSGNYRRGFDIGGKHYSHIVDPRTGRTAEEIMGVTVIAPKAVDAGALATALSVLSPDAGRKLASSVPGAEYLLVASNGRRYVSPGWNAFAQTAQQRKTEAPAASGSWNAGFELSVDVQIPQTQGFGARRPYVAVWIEDKDHYPVRTLAVLFEKTRWLNELRAWYRDDRLRSLSEGTEILTSVTSATRSPGKYTFKWDGKDNGGKPVKAGHYTVLVEAAREHGGYSLDHKEINFNGEPAQAQLPPDAELGAVTLDYHKVAR
jgi:thiamine biosynthesis lipoprotein